MERISALTFNGFITSITNQISSKVKRDPAVDRTITTMLGGKLRRDELPFGAVRLRSTGGDPNHWAVELSGSATSIEGLSKGF